MSEQLQAAQDAVAEMVGSSFAGKIDQEGPAQLAPSPDDEVQKFEFDPEFQSRVIYLAATDTSFMRKVGHLLRPDYFENAAESAFMVVILRHWQQYETTMNDKAVMALAIKDAFAAKALRNEHAAGVKEVFKVILEQQVAIRNGELFGLNADFVADKVAQFVRRQAIIAAINRSVDLIDKDPDKIEKIVLDATKVGIEQEECGGDYFATILQRTNERADESVGKRAPRGITTGHPKLDALLYHRGWGRKEITILMGGAKAGKTTALVEFGTGACLAGYNVLYVTLEVSKRIIEERADARITETPIADLVGSFADVNERVTELAMSGKCGRFYIAEFPMGSMSPSMLRALLERHKAKGWTYDLVIVDYADIMAPDYRTNDSIENSKQIYVGLRAIGQEWNVALLTATQSNREGFKAITAKAEHVSDDFNKVRIADLFVSINSTEEERRDGKARLYFAASRNQRSGMTVFIEQDFNRMRFIKAIERVE
jgi:replicative DNA helicase